MTHALFLFPFPHLIATQTLTARSYGINSTISVRLVSISVCYRCQNTAEKQAA